MPDVSPPLIDPNAGPQMAPTGIHATPDVWDAGDSGDTVTISAPAHTVNWAMVGIVLLAAFWIYNELSGGDYEDD